MPTWDGKERRMPTQDHDTLIEVVQILKNHVANFDKHIEADKIAFQDIGDKLWKHAMYIYIGIGILAAINAAPALATTIKIITGSH